MCFGFLVVDFGSFEFQLLNLPTQVLQIKLVLNLLLARNDALLQQLLQSVDDQFLLGDFGVVARFPRALLLQGVLLVGKPVEPSLCLH